MQTDQKIDGLKVVADKFMKKIVKKLLHIISRVIFYIIPSEFKLKRDTDLETKILENTKKETFNHFKEHFKKSILFKENKNKIREYAIKTSLLNDKEKKYYYLEFGTFIGRSANFFSKFVDKLYCFDSFEGLQENWGGSKLAKGHFNLNKQIPKLNSNVEPVVGWVEDTLDDFLKNHNPKINFVHMDMDTYTPTKFTLQKIKPYLVKNAIIIFDELYNYPGWEYGEYKALKEVFKGIEFDYIAFDLMSARCAIKIN